MAAPKFLAPGEHVVFHVRAHWKGLIVPVLALLAIGALVWLGLVELVPDPQTQAVWRWVIVAAGVILAVVFFLVPFLRWLTTTDTLTTKRLISREGIVTRSGRPARIMSPSQRRRKAMAGVHGAMRRKATRLVSTICSGTPISPRSTKA